MSWVSIFLLSSAASSDSFLIGFHYGIRGVRIGNASNLFLSLVCFLGTLLSMFVGGMVGRFLDPAWGRAASGVLFLALGAWMLRGALVGRKEDDRSCATVRCYSENPEIVDKDNSKVIELRESLFIGLLLCLNNVGLGIGGGMAGMPVFSIPFVCAAMSFLFIKGGCLLGGRVEPGKLSRLLEILSAVMILFLGWKELVALISF